MFQRIRRNNSGDTHITIRVWSLWAPLLFFFAVDVTWPHFFLVFYLSDAARNSEKDARSFSLCVVTHAQGPMHGRDRLLNAVNTQRSSTLAMCTLYTYVWLSYSLHGNLYVIHMQEKGISNTAFLFKGENKKAL